jgi:hypothetical protein
VEADAYGLLAKMGATPVSEVRTAGGGSVNAVWTQMRERLIKVPVSRAEHTGWNDKKQANRILIMFFFYVACMLCAQLMWASLFAQLEQSARKLTHHIEWLLTFSDSFSVSTQRRHMALHCSRSIRRIEAACHT